MTIFFPKSRMFKAIRGNDVAAAAKLLEQGYDVYSEPHDSHMNAMNLAAHLGRREIMELLLQKGGDYTRTVRYLDEPRKFEQGLVFHIACMKGHVELVEFLLKMDEWNKMLPGAKDAMGNTGLHYAAAGGHNEIVRLLLAGGFSPAVANKNGKSPIGLAHEMSHNDIVDQMKQVLKQQETPKAEAEAGWKLLSSERIAHVSVDSAVGYRLTDIFNFSTRERISLTRNLETGTELRETKSFDDFADKTVLEQAYDAYRAQGGRIDKSVIYGTRLHKARLGQ